ncbi:MAG: DNA translocase FtsK 4TM domain-containing protein [Candidatus Dadabacteria bacterium]|nr:DNA translocase FtsK 4TM domain-containing protein [Candidatus Dadabacteria bacterium]MDE0159971.1 DNA translocase FtsK 4TM domain-containing protein [Candidatus Dadabacteria bacterium]MDE0290889.1 DNA translocase FtsK 4TM domain-containing protein [Candidatus Dadabacteria bacterium]MDE0476819.1 DNA translocase FtsK 4TM domain-containing protein [Candidatus Dadabacteria bacterium]
MEKGKDTQGVFVDVMAVFFFALGVFTFVSLLAFSNLLEIDVKGAMGGTGLYVSHSLGSSFGTLSFVFPVLMFYASYVILRKRPAQKIYWKLFSTIIFLLSSTTLLGLVYGKSSLLGYSPAGGWLGLAISREFAQNILGTFGTYIIAIIVIFVSVIIATETKIATVVKIIRLLFSGVLKGISAPIGALRRAAARRGTRGKKKQDAPKATPRAAKTTATEHKQQADTEPQIVFTPPAPDKKDEPSPAAPESKWLDFSLPSIDLLDPKIDTSVEIDKEAMYRKATLIEEKLADFGVTGKIMEIRPGPVITMFEYKPAPGIKINKISSLEGDLAMGLKALSIRIIAPIPGKDVVGIEVPNESREIVVLRELFESSSFMEKKSMLTIALGKDISGKPRYMDLQTAPHLMIAGTTGSGKSVLLNAAITSLLYRATPYELKMIMIDPKMLELSIYEDIPHLLHPVVTESKKAVAALKWLVGEMDSRYRMLSEEGVRDIDSYNRKLEALEIEEKQLRWLPYIVVIIDELADLMMVSPSDVKDSIIRLAQKARAAGIHIIVSTQRPSADVVAGLIKANFPARISFLVSSKVDSRIILDTGGAETLLGKGDMLFLASGGSNLLRLQGALISDDERKRVTDFLRSQADPVYIEEITKDDPDDESAGVSEDEKDELYETALGIIAETGQASISMIQRRLKIGYNRAARIVETMEKEGLIGPQGAAGKPREVYVNMIKADRGNSD